MRTRLRSWVGWVGPMIDDSVKMPAKSTPTESLALSTLLLAAFLLLMPSVARAYVLPGKQVLALMEEKHSVPQSLEVRQVVSQLPLDGAPLLAATLRETLHFHYPDRFRSDTSGESYQRIAIRTPQDRLVVVNGQIRTGPPARFEAYTEILLKHTRVALSEYLLQMGVDLDVTSLGRFEDDYCFVIGAAYPDQNSAQLWVQKDTFRPLRLMLPPSALDPQAGTLEVRFLDWGQIEGAVYPMLVQIYRKHQLFREMRVENLRVDAVQDPVLFDTAALRATLPIWVPEPILTPPASNLTPPTSPPPPGERPL